MNILYYTLGKSEFDRVLKRYIECFTSNL
jgi:hypothetical protein